MKINALYKRWDIVRLTKESPYIPNSKKGDLGFIMETRGSNADIYWLRLGLISIVSDIEVIEFAESENIFKFVISLENGKKFEILETDVKSAVSFYKNQLNSCYGKVKTDDIFVDANIIEIIKVNKNKLRIMSNLIECPNLKIRVNGFLCKNTKKC